MMDDVVRGSSACTERAPRMFTSPVGVVDPWGLLPPQPANMTNVAAIKDLDDRVMMMRDLLKHGGRAA
ncbi:MAG: hypothetical protein ACOCUS_00690 [Polyangiales bacterium]